MSAADLAGRGFEERHVPMFWAKVDRSGLCWEWRSSRDDRGYGRFKMGPRHAQKSIRAHRVAWVLKHGPVPDGLELDHLCRNHACVRPSHLEPVTHAENVRRGIMAEVSARRATKRTHCKRGHLFNEANTYMATRGRNWRNCRTCHRLREAERRKRRRSDVLAAQPKAAAG